MKVSEKWLFVAFGLLLRPNVVRAQASNVYETVDVQNAFINLVSHGEVDVVEAFLKHGADPLGGRSPGGQIKQLEMFSPDTEKAIRKIADESKEMQKRQSNHKMVVAIDQTTKRGYSCSAYCGWYSYSRGPLYGTIFNVKKDANGRYVAGGGETKGGAFSDMLNQCAKIAPGYGLYTDNQYSNFATLANSCHLDKED